MDRHALWAFFVAGQVWSAASYIKPGLFPFSMIVLALVFQAAIYIEGRRATTQEG